MRRLSEVMAELAAAEDAVEDADDDEELAEATVWFDEVVKEFEEARLIHAKQAEDRAARDRREKHEEVSDDQ